MSDWPTDKHVCLCCGQRVALPAPPMTADRCVRSLAMFEAKGLARDELLGKHREQLAYQAPGFVEWLEARFDA